MVVLTFPRQQSAFISRSAAGGFEGLDYDLVTTLARRVGVDLEIRAVDGFEKLIPALLRGDGDLIASSFSVTAERSALVEFSVPYFPVVVMVVVRDDSAIRSESDLNGRIGAAVEGSSLEERLRARGGPSRSTVDTADSFGAVADGRADFALVDSTGAMLNLGDYPGLRVGFSFSEGEPYAFAFRPGSDLAETVRLHFDELKRTGYFYQLVERHFGRVGREVFELGRRAGRE